MLHDLKIILAEDDYDDRSFFMLALSELDNSHRLQVAQDGELLLQMLAADSDVPDLIVLDVNMPRKNGINCLQEIRSLRRYDQTPIVMMSTSSEEKLVDQAYEAGASCFIQKPDNFPVLKEVVRFCITLQGGHLQRERKNFLVLHPGMAGC